MMLTIEQIARGTQLYRAAYLATPGDEDARDQAGFAAIETEFSDLYEALDLLQIAQEAMDLETPEIRMAAE